MCCRTLGVSRSSYDGWLSRPPSTRTLSNEVLSEKIAPSYAESRRTSGYRRVTSDLNDARGEEVGRQRVAGLMKVAGIQGVTR